MVSAKIPDNALSQVETYLIHLQKNLCHTLESIDGKGRFKQDLWTREEGGGGNTCVMHGGALFEKAGVNFSFVSGGGLPPSGTLHRPELVGCTFSALGVSLVLHPHNPYVPTTHANVRFFLANRPSAPPVWWFGGGFDLTPYYGFVEDAKHWHQIAKQACDPFGDNLYAEFKDWCDQYFFIKHRNEARGVGGLFFDDYNRESFEHSFGFMQSIGDHFQPAYMPILERRRNLSYGEREKNFQLYRRGRYVEYNLVYDRGTLFGLQSGGRTESILMSLPPEVRWQYNWQPEPGSPEHKLYTDFLPVKDWINA